MFLKTLIISSEATIIRQINFRKGMNLIIDETPITEIIDKKETGKCLLSQVECGLYFLRLHYSPLETLSLRVLGAT